MKVSNKPAAALNNAIQAKDMQNKENAIKKSGKDGKSISNAATLDPAQVNLSTKAKQIKKATDIAKKDTVDEAKVAHFQNLIDSGKYKIDSAKVADALVNEHIKLPT